MNETAILLPLAVGAAANLLTIFIHTLFVGATVRFIRRMKRLRPEALGFWTDVGIVTVVISLALVAHLLEICIWAALFVQCGEFSAFSSALNHSAVNYSTLGYGDVIMSRSWRFLGPLEAANGMLLFGVSTAVIFAIIQGVVQARFADLRA